MTENNKAEYSPSKFTMDLTEIDWSEDGQITNETFPMFAHEYCHYRQDVSTISGISGFYYKIVDVSELTKITCDGSGKTINIPILNDKDGHPIMKHKYLYSYYCGDVFTCNGKFDFNHKSKETTELKIGNIKLNIPLYRLFHCGYTDKLVGTYALQEAHAYYIQKIIESEILKNNKNTRFKIPADELPNYPYRFVDYLFESFNIKTSVRLKAYIVDLCLDTFLPLVTLIRVLEYLKEKGITENKLQLYKIVENAWLSFKFSSSPDIQNIIAGFLGGLIVGENRDYFSKGINWYLGIINSMRKLRNKRAYWISDALSSINYLKGFINCFQPPLILKDDQICYFKYSYNKNIINQDVLDSVTVLFLFLHIFSLTTESNLKYFNDLVCCPLLNNCQIVKEIKSDYVCKNSPWEISKTHKETNKACFYRKALIELGLDQNKIELGFNV